MASPRQRRKRDYAAEERRRNELARQRGFANRYQRRVAGIPVGQRAAARGHIGRADFLRALREGDLILCDITAPQVFRDRRGVERYDRIEKTVIPALRPLGKGFSQPPQRYFTLRRLTRRQLLDTIEAEVAAGVEFSKSPSMDQRKLLSKSEIEGGY